VTLPNVILGGAQKCGTSSLFDTLAAHPACLASDPKEPTFFSRQDSLEEPARYEACFVPEQDAPPPQVVFEGSTAYLADPEVPGRVLALLGDQVRWVFLLRDPAERAISGYFHLLKRGDERREISTCLAGTDSLHERLAQERNAVDEAVSRREVDLSRYRHRYDDPRWPFRYLANSDYAGQLGPYVETFGAERVHVLTLEQILAEPAATFGRLAEFLDIDGSAMPERLERHSNPTRVPRRDTVGRAASSLLSGPAGGSLRRRLPAVARRLEAWRSRAKPAVDPAIREGLRRLFADQADRIAACLGGKQPPTGW
jgi:hypothetical protein